ncbi:MAG TPA: D-alanyl-D-alanine dipeptidase [Alphaproteobacteria bacterium]|nr:D-alanyl-D-alanine dipeptidase [Alphaproteobacteria bacterium]
MVLVEITPASHSLTLELVYATAQNFTGAPIYRRAACYLNPEAAQRLGRAAELAAALSYRFKIFDAYRPTEAQWRMWSHRPDPQFLADPRRGSPHSRGAALDLTLVDARGDELEMGTSFDAFTPRSHHGDTLVSRDAQRNRHLLLGIMSAAGWDFYKNEWWHYQLFDARRYPLISDRALQQSMM